jgi:hypothetical protein
MAFLCLYDAYLLFGMELRTKGAIMYFFWAVVIVTALIFWLYVHPEDNPWLYFSNLKKKSEK